MSPHPHILYKVQWLGLPSPLLCSKSEERICMFFSFCKIEFGLLSNVKGISQTPTSIQNLSYFCALLKTLIYAIWRYQVMAIRWLNQLLNCAKGPRLRRKPCQSQTQTRWRLPLPATPPVLPRFSCVFCSAVVFMLSIHREMLHIFVVGSINQWRPHLNGHLNAIKSGN